MPLFKNPKSFFPVDLDLVVVPIIPLVYTTVYKIAVNWDTFKYTLANLIIDVSIVDATLDIRAVNGNETIEFGKLEDIAASGIQNIELSGFPETGNNFIQIQARRSVAGLTNPVINQSSISSS
jgi:hypothetical protein